MATTSRTPSGDFWAKDLVNSTPAWFAVAGHLYSAPCTTGTGCTCVLCR